MTLTKRERIWLIATLVVLVVGGNYLLLSQLGKAWGSLGRELKDKSADLALIRSTLDREPEWRRDLERLHESLGKAEHFVQTSDVLRKIEEVGAASGIIIQSRRPLPGNEKDVYRELPVQCTIEATTESLVKFLHALQTGSGFIRVEQLQVSPRPDSANILRCDIQIRALASKSETPAS